MITWRIVVNTFCNVHNYFCYYSAIIKIAIIFPVLNSKRDNMAMPGKMWPLPDAAAAAAWIAPGAVMQMAATAPMLAAMRLRSFVVAIAGVAITTWPRTGLVLDLG